MKYTTLKINENITCYLTPATANKIKAEIEAERREAEERMQLFKALERAAANEDWDFYSDLYKDLYGVRPRW